MYMDKTVKDVEAALSGIEDGATIAIGGFFAAGVPRLLLRALAEKGVIGAVRADPTLARGVNVMEGKVTLREVAEATGNPYFPLEYVLPIEYT